MPDPSDLAARLESVDAVFKALASPPRRQILLVLHFRGGRLTAGDIQERFGCSWPTTSRHLKVLREAGLVTVEVRGRSRSYALNYERLDGVVAGWMAEFQNLPDPSVRPLPTRQPGT